MNIVENSIKEHIEAVNSLHTIKSDIQKLADQTVETIRNGGTIFLFGNGGSASDAQHIAAEFTGRFVKEREPMAAIALTTDTSALTAISNDYGYDQVFVRQVKALVRPGDLVIGISTSGNSGGVNLALVAAKEKGAHCASMTGRDGGEMVSLCDTNVVVPSTVTARIQECHILIGHIICEASEATLP
ncbi:MAG: D-sedoheptulose 7-phosphate isomerase [Fibrobacterales bacterium]